MKVEISKLFSGALKGIYKFKLSILSSLLFLFFYGLNLNFHHCLEKTNLINLTTILQYIFMVSSIIFIISNLMLIKIIEKDISVLRDMDKPSRIGEFKDIYLLTPFLLMAIIGGIKIFFILFSSCKINKEISIWTYIIFAIIFLVAVRVNYLFLLFLKFLFSLKKFFNFRRKVSFSFFIFNLLLLIILFLLLNASLNPYSFIEFNKDVNIIIYSLLFYTGITSLMYTYRIIKKKNKNFKLFMFDDIKSIFIYFIISVGIIFISCFPEFVKKFIKNFMLFVNCIINS